MFSRKAFEKWYFEYSEAEREFLDAKQSFEVKNVTSVFTYSALMQIGASGDLVRSSGQNQSQSTMKSRNK